MFKNMEVSFKNHFDESHNHFGEQISNKIHISTKTEHLKIYPETIYGHISLPRPCITQQPLKNNQSNFVHSKLRHEHMEHG
jgi:hypothetical protein